MTIKDMRRQYYGTRARPETHELHVNKSDSVKWLVEYYNLFGPDVPLAVFMFQVKCGEKIDLYFKGILTKFFCDGPTQLVSKELV
jgi:hypothetical protein